MPNEVELHNLRKAHHESIRTREEFQTSGGNYRYWKALIVVTAIVAASAVILGAFAIREVSRMVNPIQVPAPTAPASHSTSATSSNSVRAVDKSSSTHREEISKLLAEVSDHRRQLAIVDSQINSLRRTASIQRIDQIEFQVNLTSLRTELKTARQRTSIFTRRLGMLQAAASIQRIDQIEFQVNLTSLRTELKTARQRTSILTRRLGMLQAEVRRFSTLPFPYNGYVYSITSVPLTWQEAREECQSFNARLAVEGVRSYNVRVSLASMFSPSIKKTSGQLWVGLTDLAQERIWRWIDGSLASSREVRWAMGQPDNLNGSEHCGEIWPVFYNFRMNDESCRVENYGLCEKRFAE